MGDELGALPDRDHQYSSRQRIQGPGMPYRPLLYRFANTLNDVV
jgi:hypothetical protein